MQQRTTIDLLAGRKSSGEPVREEVLVDHLDGNKYRVIATPGLVLGIARDDLIRWDGGDADPQVLERGGYLAVQVYGPHELADTITGEVEAAGGHLDGRAPGLTVFSIPVTAGFARVEQIVNGLCARAPGVEWYFGNVYAEDGVSPLNWW